VTPTKLTLTNFCQHPYLSVELHRGLTAITGPNGCGKSNFCSTGMSFAITGKALGSVNKSELLRRGTSSGHTEIEFVHDGKECRLVRNLHNSGVKLHGLSEEPLSRKEANDMMIEILGQPFDLFLETCFATQEGFVAPLTQTHSERMAYLQKIADVKRAEVLRGIVQEKGVNKLPMYVDKAVELEDLEKQFASMTEELVVLQEKASDLSEMKAEYDPLYEQAQAVLAMVPEAEYKAKIHAATVTHSTAQAKLAAFETGNEVTDLEQPESVSGDDTAKFEMYRALVAWKLQLQDARDQLKELAVPEEPEVLSVEKLEKDVHDIGAEMHRLAAKAKLAEEGVCPTCLRESDVDDPAKAVQEYEAQRERWASHNTALQEAKQKTATYNQALAIYKSKRVQLTDDIKRAEDGCEMFKGGEGFDEPAHIAKVAAWDEYSKKLSARAGLTKMHEQLKGDVRVAQAAQAAAAEIKYVSDTDREQAQQFKQRYADLCTRASTMATDMARLESTAQAVEGQVQAIRKEQEVNAKSRDLRQLFERGREVLHRDCLPKACMRTMVTYLNALLGDYLSMFSVNFRAYLDDNFDFVYDDAESQGINVRGLSGGQKVALAIAWKFALSELLSSKVNLLVLDEPSIWLDEDNISQVKEVLKAAGRHLAGAGLVSTHEEKLLPAFHHVTDISEQG
jgi:DNA repair exonuclease SbcCD ATPase subunit